MSAEAQRQLEEARMRVLEAIPCVHCGKPAGEHTTEELKAHLDLEAGR